MTRQRHALALILLLAAALMPAALAANEIDLADESVPVLLGASADDQFGAALAGGDVDGDGRDEVFVGAPGRSDTSGVPHAGAVYVLEVDDLRSLAGQIRIGDVPHAVLAGTDARGRLGTSIVVADLDGDGIDDLASGSPTSSGGTIAEGAVRVWFGGPGALAGNARPDLVLLGDAPGARLGASMLASDLDGDGAQELVVSAPGGAGRGDAARGRVYVFTGRSLRGAGSEFAAADAATAWVRGAAQGDAPYGLCRADVDADGTPDLLIGSHRADGTPDGPEDAGVLYSVPVAGLLEAAGASVASLAGWSMQGPTARSSFGRAIASGDVDGDGLHDVLVTACTSKAERKKLTAAGEVYLLFGAETPGESRSGPSLQGPDVVRWRGRSNSDVTGFPVRLEDVNADLLDDVLFSARYSDGPEGERRDCGEVYLFRGSLRSVVAVKATDIGRADIVIIGERENDAIGESLLAVDVAGTDQKELLIGAPDVSRPDASDEVTAHCGAVLFVPGEFLTR